jgi:hypothetical protein
MFSNLAGHLKFKISVTVVNQCHHRSFGTLFGVGAGRPRRNRGTVCRRARESFPVKALRPGLGPTEPHIHWISGPLRVHTGRG